MAEGRKAKEARNTEWKRRPNSSFLQEPMFTIIALIHS
jgi:hypothetical protein